MVKWMEQLVREFTGPVPTVDVMGFKVVAGGELTARLKFAAFAADQYWKAWQAKLEKEKFDWAKYEDQMNWYYKDWAMRYDAWLQQQKLNLAQRELDVKSIAAADAAQAQIVSAALHAAGAVHAAAIKANAAKSMAKAELAFKEKQLQQNKEAIKTSVEKHEEEVDKWKQTEQAFWEKMKEYLTIPSTTIQTSGSTTQPQGTGWVEWDGQKHYLNEAWGEQGVEYDGTKHGLDEAWGGQENG